MKKICNRCNVEKDVSEYYKNSKRVYPYCKQCAKSKYAQKHYKKNKELYKVRSSSRGKKKREDWVKFKSKFSCKLCGESRSWVLEFHHLDPTVKEGLVPYFFLNKSKKKFEEELNKCVPLCRNCHADVHYTGKVLR